DTDGLRATVTPATPGNNLLRCPGFEGGACGWQLSPNGASVALPSHSGNGALQLTTGFGAQAAQQVFVHPGSSYTVSGWMKPSLFFGTGSFTAQFFDAQGAAIGAATVVGSVIGFGSQYTYSEQSLVAPATAVSLRVVLVTMGGAGTCLFDDLRVRDHNL